MTSLPGWYLFITFVAGQNTEAPMGPFGPFDSLGECKASAKVYLNSDLEEAVGECQLLKTDGTRIDSEKFEIEEEMKFITEAKP